MYATDFNFCLPGVGEVNLEFDCLLVNSFTKTLGSFGSRRTYQLHENENISLIIESAWVVPYLLIAKSFIKNETYRKHLVYLSIHTPVRVPMHSELSR